MERKPPGTRRGIAVIVGLMLAVSAPTGAHAQGVFNGVCTLGVTIDFFGTISLDSGSLDFTVDGTGQCTITGIGVPPNANVLLESDSTTTTNSNCASLVAAGAYFINFDNGVPDSGGTFRIRGNAFTAVMDFSGPNFTGVMLLSSTGGGCTAGVGAIDYAGRLVLVDP